MMSFNIYWGSGKLRQIIPAFLLYLTFCEFDANAEERRLAFVVGVSSYDNLLPQFQLRNPANDARAIADEFGHLGYDVSFEANVTRQRFHELKHNFIEKISGSDTTVVLFLSGHGMEIGGQNFLLPSDVEQQEYGRQERLKSQSISIPELLLDVRKRKPARTIMILDACRKHPLIPSEYEMAFEEKVGVRIVGGTRGEYLMYSAGPGQAALDRLYANDPIPHSVYVRHLLPMLRKPGLNIQNLSTQLKNDVFETAQTIDHTQIPTASDQLIGEFCFSGCEKNLSEVYENDVDYDPIRVRRAQYLLSSLGYELGPSDGIFGKRTREALISFQHETGITVPYGRLTAEAEIALENAYAERSSASQSRAEQGQDHSDDSTQGMLLATECQLFGTDCPDQPGSERNKQRPGIYNPLPPVDVYIPRSSAW